MYGDVDDFKLSHELWYIQVIITLAIGKLYAVNFEQGGHDLLGQELFGFAHHNFPSMSVQHANGRLRVELNALMAMYLQMMNRKEEAHLYVRSPCFFHALLTAIRLPVLSDLQLCMVIIVRMHEESFSGPKKLRSTGCGGLSICKKGEQLVILDLTKFSSNLS